MHNNLKTNTLVTVVTYNPKINLLSRNILALTGQFNNILIVDNGSKNIAEVKILGNNYKIKTIALPKNMGIAHALNIGLDKASERKLEWLLTMDQDSIIPKNFSLIYEKIITKYINVGLLGWSKDHVYPDPREVNFLISSGCLTKTKIALSIGGFDENLFVHQVDFDFSLKIKPRAKILITNGTHLYHELGIETGVKMRNGASFKDHSNTAYYYIIRNCIVLFKRYFLKYSLLSLQYFLVAPLYDFYFHFKYNNNKINSLKVLFMSVKDGLINKLGESKYKFD